MSSVFYQWVSTAAAIDEYEINDAVESTIISNNQLRNVYEYKDFATHELLDAGINLSREIEILLKDRKNVLAQIINKIKLENSGHTSTTATQSHVRRIAELRFDDLFEEAMIHCRVEPFVVEDFPIPGDIREMNLRANRIPSSEDCTSIHGCLSSYPSPRAEYLKVQLFESNNANNLESSIYNQKGSSTLHHLRTFQSTLQQSLHTLQQSHETQLATTVSSVCKHNLLYLS